MNSKPTYLTEAFQIMTTERLMPGHGELMSANKLPLLIGVGCGFVLLAFLMVV